MRVSTGSYVMKIFHHCDLALRKISPWFSMENSLHAGGVRHVGSVTVLNNVEYYWIARMNLKML